MSLHLIALRPEPGLAATLVSSERYRASTAEMPVTSARSASTSGASVKTSCTAPTRWLGRLSGQTAIGS